MIRAVIFDYNGVLVDDEPIHCELIREVLAEEGVAISERDYHEEYLGYDDRGCFEVALGRDGQSVAPARIEAMIERKAKRYAEWARTSLKSFPGAVEAVQAMAERWPVAICSGALRPEIEGALERLGLDDAVMAIISAEDTRRCKPDPEGYFLALDALRDAMGDDIEAGHCLVIEDSRAGIEAAKAAGMWAVGVPHTYSADELRRAGADAVIDSLERLDPAWVCSLFQSEVSP